MSAEPRWIEATPINGYLGHAIRNQPENHHRTAPFILITYQRALCGVGRGGMRIRLDEAGEPREWRGIDGCDRCHARIYKLKRDLTKIGAILTAEKIPSTPAGDEP